jgi:Ca2+-binding RTX toxin-like protein
VSTSRRLATAVAAVLAVLAWPSGALGGTLTETGFDGFFTVTYTFTGAPGETNVVTIQTTGGDYAVTDANNVITLSNAPQCSGSGTHTVHCSDFQISDYEINAIVQLGDMNDSVSLNNSAVDFQADGGPGNDTIYGPTTAGSCCNATTTLNGGAGDDTLNGGFLGEVLNGGPGNDSLAGGDGNDTLVGGPGADTMDGGNGFDTVDYTGDWYDDGGGGTYGVYVKLDGVANDGNLVNDSPDPYVVYSGGDNVEGSVEKVIGSEVADTIIDPSCTGFCVLTENTFVGGAGDDTLDGGPSDDILDGGGGNDTIAGGTGVDTFQAGDAGSGSNLTMTLTNTSLTGSFGTDSLTSIEKATLQGGNGNDTLDASGSTIPVTLSAGQLLSSNGNDVLIGGSGNDILEGRGGCCIYPDNDTFTGGPGNDDIRAGGSAPAGMNGTDRLVESGGSFTLTNSSLTGASGTDTLGGINATTLSGSGGTDTIDTSGFTGGPATITGLGGNDTLTGGSTNDALDGGTGIDTLQAGAGDDTLTGGTENDTLDGGTGTDTVVESGDLNFTLTDGSLIGLGIDSLVSIDKATLTGGAGNNTINGSGFSGLVNFDGLGGNDTLTSGPGGGTLAGGVGMDVLNGGAGTDTLNGGADNDTLNGNGGVDALNGGDNDDTLSGGPGNDSLDGGNNTDRVVESGGNFTLQNGALIGFAGSDTLLSIEVATLTGSTGDDVLNASSFTQGPVILNGLAGLDQLFGGSGNDTLDGGADADTFDAGGGDDSVQAKDGAADTSIDCGDGANDAAYVDPSDPPTSNCEVDTVPPPDPAITSKPAGLTNSAGATFGFTDSEGGASFVCSLDGAAYSACGSPKTYSGLGDATHSFSVKAKDAAGNLSGTASYSWKVDRTPPDTTITSPAPNPTSTGASFAFTATEAASSFACSLDGSAFAACSSPKTYSSLAQGSHTFAVKATDAAGNTDPTAATRTWTISLTQPCVVPKVIGKRLAKARAAITKAHCKVGKITRKFSTKRKKGRVLGERPKAGTTLRAGAKVNLVVGKGPKPRKRH